MIDHSTTQRATPNGAPARSLTIAGLGSDVRAMYEAYPYPSPLVGDGLIEDVANSLRLLYGERSLNGARILDAGCGTGHRLLAVARAFPESHCVGLDMTVVALDIARSLAEKHRLRNVRFERANLVDLQLAEQFDLVISTGVIHHLEDPAAGLARLAAMLADDGVIMVWCYHALGEHQRLLNREMLLTMWDRATGLEQGIGLMHDLGLRIAAGQYGRGTAARARELEVVNDVDAYLHPIVHAYRFEDAIDLFRACGMVDWMAVNSITRPNASSLIDLEDAETSEDAKFFCQGAAGLFDAEPLTAAFRRLGRIEKLRVLEIKLQPNGFTVIAGRGQSYRQLGRRVQGNIIHL